MENEKSIGIDELFKFVNYQITPTSTKKKKNGLKRIKSLIRRRSKQMLQNLRLKRRNLQ
jgi:hypothetical protein